MRRSRAGVVSFVACCLALAAGVSAQEPAPDQAPDPQALQRRLDELEAKVQALEAERRDEPVIPREPAPSTGPAAGPTVAAVDTSGVGWSVKDGLLLELPWSMSLRVHGQVRFRGEYRDPRDYRIPGTFGRPAAENADDAEDFVSQRTWITLEFKVREHLRAGVGIMDARLWGDTPIGADSADLFLREGWVELDRILDQPLKVRVGRMLLPRLGDQRVFSDLDWAPVPRIWDAVQATWEPEGWFITAMASNLREAQVQTPRGDENDDFWLAGAYVSNRMLEGCEFDTYFFWRELHDDVFLNEARFGNGFTTRPGDREDFSVGGRMRVEAGPTGFTLEGLYQFGQQAGDRIEAFAAAGKVWFKLPLPEHLPRLRLAAEYAYASGDRDPSDGRLNTFDPIFPFAHAYHGHQDLVLWSNIHAFSLQFTAGMPKPVEWLELHADGHVFWLDKTRDAWYAVNKTPIRRVPSGAAGSELGSELDIYAQIRLWENRIFVWTGFSQFFTGKYVRDTGKSEDQRWAFLLFEVNF